MENEPTVTVHWWGPSIPQIPLPCPVPSSPPDSPRLVWLASVHSGAASQEVSGGVWAVLCRLLLLCCCFCLGCAVTGCRPPGFKLGRCRCCSGWEPLVIFYLHLVCSGPGTFLRRWLPTPQSQGKGDNKGFWVRTSVWGWLVWVS